MRAGIRKRLALIGPSFACGAVDFCNLLLLLVGVADDTRRRSQHRFARVLVDEFQDTNPVLRLLAPPPGSPALLAHARPGRRLLPARVDRRVLVGRRRCSADRAGRVCSMARVHVLVARRVELRP